MFVLLFPHFGVRVQISKTNLTHRLYIYKATLKTKISTEDLCLKKIFVVCQSDDVRTCDCLRARLAPPRPAHHNISRS